MITMTLAQSVIISAKTLFPNEVTLFGTTGPECGGGGGCSHSAQCRDQEDKIIIQKLTDPQVNAVFIHNLKCLL